MSSIKWLASDVLRPLLLMQCTLKQLLFGHIFRQLVVVHCPQTNANWAMSSDICWQLLRILSLLRFNYWWEMQKVGKD